MKKIFLSLVLALFALQVNAASLAWDAIDVNTSGTHSALEVNPANLTGQMSFDSTAGGLTTDTWSYTLDDDSVIENVAIEFFDSQMNIGSVFLDGQALTETVQGSGSFATKLWVWTGLLTSGVHTLTLNDIDVLAANGQYQIKVSAVPIPAAVWLFGSALVGLVGVSRRKVKAVAA